MDNPVQPLDRVEDEELIDRARNATEEEARACLETLYRRYHRRVAHWSLRICGDAGEAADLAQEVFLRVHERLDSFRQESRFSTWLYAVTRNVTINRSVAARRGRVASLDQETLSEPAADAPDPAERASSAEIADRLRRAIREDLEPLEAEVLYLHHVDGMTLPAITECLGLRNKSGAKAYLVGAKRKLRRKFGRWLAAQTVGESSR